MKPISRLVVFAALGSLMAAASAFGQDRVRVTRDQTMIWRPGFIVVEAIVQSGTELDVVARVDSWYEVVLPEGTERPRSTGFVALSRVEPLDGTSPGSQRQRGPVAGRAPLARHGIRGFGHVGVGWFAADQTFTSVLGLPAGAWFGGGVEARRGRWTIEGAVEIFRRTGERAFVLNGEVFPLGIPDTVTLVPVAATAGYRHQVSRTWSVAAGGGLGRYFLREASTVGGETETFSSQATSYHVRADLEWHRRGPLAGAAEVQYTWVPRALSQGLASSFDEHDLGGLQVRFKILFGR